MMRAHTAGTAVFAVCVAFCTHLALCGGKPIKIAFVEKGTDIPVPMLDVSTTFWRRYVSDNAGLVAIDDPDVIDVLTYLRVVGDGYAREKTKPNDSGWRVRYPFGGAQTCEVERFSPFRCVGRLTGTGLFAQSQKLGVSGDDRNDEDAGRSGVHASRFGTGIFWVWDRSPTLSSPRGIPNVTAATTGCPAFPADVRAPIRSPYRNVVDRNGEMCGVFEKGKGIVRLSGLINLFDRARREHLCALWTRYETRDRGGRGKWNEITDVPVAVGLCEWKREKRVFVIVSEIWKEGAGDLPDALPDGHATRYRTARGRRLVLFGNPFPKVALRDSYEDWRAGKWKRTGGGADVETSAGDRVTAASGSIAWSGYRNRWVAVFQRKNAPVAGEGARKTSPCRELWYAEAESPVGPWRGGTLLHDFGTESFLSPYIHSLGTDPNSRWLLFEGNRTERESGRRRAVWPRSSDCETLYSLDLDDPRLPPQAKEGRK